MKNFTNKFIKIKIDDSKDDLKMYNSINSIYDNLLKNNYK